MPPYSQITCRNTTLLRTLQRTSMDQPSDGRETFHEIFRSSSLLPVLKKKTNIYSTWHQRNIKTRYSIRRPDEGLGLGITLA